MAETAIKSDQPQISGLPNAAQALRGSIMVMMRRSGHADLPLHGGRVPAWLADRMTRLGTAISESVLLHYGPSELLSRLSDPFWFQALGSVMGMDWHSSGITTSVVGALKRGLNPRAHELGIYICGGRGKHSRKTPDELRAVAEKTGLDGDALARTSRLTAQHRQQCHRGRLPDLFALLCADRRWRVGRHPARLERSSRVSKTLSLAFGDGARFHL